MRMHQVKETATVIHYPVHAVLMCQMHATGDRARHCYIHCSAYAVFKAERMHQVTKTVTLAPSSAHAVFIC